MEMCITKLRISTRISSKLAEYLDQETNHQTIMLGSCMVKLLWNSIEQQLTGFTSEEEKKEEEEMFNKD